MIHEAGQRQPHIISALHQTISTIALELKRSIQWRFRDYFEGPLGLAQMNNKTFISYYNSIIVPLKTQQRHDMWNFDEIFWSDLFQTTLEKYIQNLSLLITLQLLSDSQRITLAANIYARLIQMTSAVSQTLYQILWIASIQKVIINAQLLLSKAFQTEASCELSQQHFIDNACVV